MAKKPSPEQKILLMTDTASDLPDEALTIGGVVMLPIPITIDGKGYLERVDFTAEEFYERLIASREIPTTSQILSMTYQQAFEDALEQGYTHVILTTITSKGSNMFQSAVMGKRMFREAHPDAALQIVLLDSGTYTAGYGYPIIEASKMVAAGKTAEEIVSYLDDFYSCCEIVFATYSLEYAKKSGRIPVAAAFVGEMLGLRPIISIVDGVTTIVEKVRGDKNVVPHVLDYAYERAVNRKETVCVVGAVDAYGDEIMKLAAKKFGKAPRGLFKVGAAIAINSGPKVVGIVIQGQKRVGTRAREQDFA